jgi:hypothetical protein
VSECWICGLSALDADKDQPRIGHPDGRWAHEYCVSHTFAGSSWRLRLAVQAMLEAYWRSIKRALGR